MKEEFTEYLLGLGMTQPLVNRVEELIGVYRRLTIYEVEDIYVSEYMKKDGRREYEDLRIYSTDCYGLYREFLINDTIILSHYTSINNVTIDRDNYDFSEAETNSKVTIFSVFYSTEATMIMKATGLNCNKIIQIFHKYIKPYITSI